MENTRQSTQEAAVIKRLKAEYDLQDPNQVLALYALLQSGEYTFRSKEGIAFDDLIYDLAIEAKKKNEAAAGKVSKGRKSKSEQTKQTKKEKVAKKVVVYTRREYLLRKMLVFTLSLVMLGCFGYFGLYSYEAYQKEKEVERLNRLKENETIAQMYEDMTYEVIDAETGETTTYTVLEQYKSLYNQNKNLIGWLKIDDTIIDYPVMQTGDNEFYLNHNIKQENDKNGTLFLDYQCDVIKPSTNYIIYGHNMRSGKMFGSLSAYKDASYYEAHPYIQFDTIYEEGTYQVMFAFPSRIYNEDEIVFKYYQFIDANSAEEFRSNIKEMREMSLYDTGVTAEYGDHLLTLSTCDYEEENGRFVVVAKQIK